jgi:hypothetical protein
LNIIRADFRAETTRKAALGAAFFFLAYRPGIRLRDAYAMLRP